MTVVSDRIVAVPVDQVKWLSRMDLVEGLGFSRRSAVEILETALEAGIALPFASWKYGHRLASPMCLSGLSSSALEEGLLLLVDLYRSKTGGWSRQELDAQVLSVPVGDAGDNVAPYLPWSMEHLPMPRKSLDHARAAASGMGAVASRFLSVTLPLPCMLSMIANDLIPYGEADGQIQKVEIMESVVASGIVSDLDWNLADSIGRNAVNLAVSRFHALPNGSAGRLLHVIDQMSAWFPDAFRPEAFLQRDHSGTSALDVLVDFRLKLAARPEMPATMGSRGSLDRLDLLLRRISMAGKDQPPRSPVRALSSWPHVWPEAQPVDRPDYGPAFAASHFVFGGDGSVASEARLAGLMHLNEHLRDSSGNGDPPILDDLVVAGLDPLTLGMDGSMLLTKLFRRGFDNGSFLAGEILRSFPPSAAQMDVVHANQVRDEHLPSNSGAPGLLTLRELIALGVLFPMDHIAADDLSLAYGSFRDQIPSGSWIGTGGAPFALTAAQHLDGDVSSHININLYFKIRRMIDHFEPADYLVEGPDGLTAESVLLELHRKVLEKGGPRLESHDSPDLLFDLLSQIAAVRTARMKEHIDMAHASMKDRGDADELRLKSLNHPVEDPVKGGSPAYPGSRIRPGQ